MFNKLLAIILVCISSHSFAQEIAEQETICSPNGCYVIEKVLGSGAFGKVYAVRDAQGQKFALKSYIPNGFQGAFADILANAEREFNIGQIMDHPNIVKSIEWFEANDQSQYVLLELIKGEMIHTTPPKSTNSTKAIEASLQLLDALKYGIAKEYIYLDLHGGNVMLTENFETKVVDISSFFAFDELHHLFHKQTEKKLGNKSIREEKFDKFMRKHKNIFENVKISKDTSSDYMTKFFLAANFSAMNEMIFDIIDKSDMDRQLKMELFSEISKIKWSYREDMQTGIYLPVNIYFDQLQEVLLKALSQ